MYGHEQKAWSAKTGCFRAIGEKLIRFFSQDGFWYNQAPLAKLEGLYALNICCYYIITIKDSHDSTANRKVLQQT